MLEWCDASLLDFVTNRCEADMIPKELDVLLHLTRGLQHIHDQNFVHGKINLKNAMISSQKQIKISNFCSVYSLSEDGFDEKEMKKFDLLSLGILMLSFLTKKLHKVSENLDDLSGKRKRTPKMIPTSFNFSFSDLENSNFEKQIIRGLISNHEPQMISLCDVLQILEREKAKEIEMNLEKVQWDEKELMNVCLEQQTAADAEPMEF
jgi:serine/threonine protein kinase